MAPRRAVLLRRRRQQRQPVGAARSGPAGSRRRVHRRLASVGSAVRAAQVRRPRLPYADDANGFELVPDIEAVRDQHEIVSFDMEPGDVHRVPLPHAALRAGHGGSHDRPAPGGQLPLPRRAMRGSRPGRGCTRRRTTRSSQAQPLDDERFPLVPALDRQVSGGRSPRTAVDVHRLAVADQRDVHLCRRARGCGSWRPTPA